MKNPWRKLSSKIVYKNSFIQVKEDKVIKPSGGEGIYGFVDKSKSVLVVPISSNNEVYLVRQWRYTLGRRTNELPWGGIEKGESVLNAAKRELKEETGLIAKKWINLGKIDVLVSYGNEVASVFLARNLKAGKNDLDDTEDISHFKIPLTKAISWSMDGKISSGPCIAAIFRAKYYLKI